MSRLRVGRQFLLLVLCGGMIAVFGNALFGNPKASVREPAAAFSFPPQVPLDGWPMLDSQALADKVLWNGKVAPGWRYRYLSRTRPLTIELRYVSDMENSQQDLPKMLEMFTQIPPAVVEPATTRSQPGIGFYSLFEDRKMTYLSACVNPRGGSTVTGKQFRQNRFLHDVRFDRLLPWILGQDKLMDNRCLWMMLSLPRVQVAPDTRDQTLETAGVTWLRWWQAHFPAS